MGLFDLFKKKKVETPPKPIKDVPADADDFYFNHEKQIDKWEERISDAIDYADNPEKTLKSFEKAFALCDQFEAFCRADPNGGAEYYESEGIRFRENTQSEYDDYMKERYEEDLKEWNEAQEYEKFKKQVKSKLLSAVKKSNKIAQADLKKLLSEEEASLYNSSIKALEESEKIVRTKEGNKIYFTVGR